MSSKTVKNNKSIKRQYFRVYAVILALTLILFSIFLYLNLRQILTANFRRQLQNKFTAIHQELSLKPNDERTITHRLSELFARGEGLGSIAYALFSAEGLVLAKNRNYEEDSDSVDFILNKRDLLDESWYESTFKSATGEYFVITQRIMNPSGGNYFLQFALDKKVIDQPMRSFMAAIFIGIPVIVLAGLAAAFYLSRRSLGPISDLDKLLREKSIANLDRSLPFLADDPEIVNLTKRLNDVFASLGKAYRKNTQFAADVSHELRIPISAIKGEAEVILQRERKSVEEYRSVLGKIITEINRLNTMINDLLFLSRSDTPKEQTKLVKVNLSALLAELTEFYKALAQAQQIDLTLEGAGDIHVMADRSQMTRLFGNIIDNAIKYTPEGGTVKLKTEIDGHFVLVSVEDTGCGIPQDELTHIFDRFYRVDKSRSRESGGAGLGLSICKSITEAHRGEITLSSRVSAGSVFTVRLPLAT